MSSIATLLFQSAGIFGWLQLGLMFLGGLWALVCAVLLAMRWRVPPIVAVAPLLAVPALLCGGASWSEAAVADALVNADPSMRVMLLAVGTSEIVSQGLLAPLVVPVAALLAAGGLAAGVRAPRTWGSPAAVFAIAG